ncbi:centrosomal protein of 95 kDa isoform X2 [Sinocyclocheilus anshuiensis]|uniref:centrosomal protein of 95 kDa isoform X2 n=1 Tax=Sinocyclocheilus anshuiensis TaxID=1608454 RepID=UPI0007BA524A|nr:PREDICTED: centrosomal protein of 95 kDa isoform X2 [Sinocyclocheilus anshuiensis]
MGPEERDWVDMANNVLLKCRINLRLERISECDANVFVALYEAILGEKVPDYVAAERQEDDIHNVQSVIDSLALDYLQISLSHITGENIVRGEKESIRNLLEIFDGLLDYLIEQQSDEEPQHKGLNGKTNAANAAYQPRNQDTGKMQCQPLTIHSVLQSIEHSLHSWDGNEFKSTELIQLGDSAHMFMAKQEVLAAVLPQVGTVENTVSTRATLLKEPLWPAIPLQPPYQTTTQRSPPSTDTAPFSEDQTIQKPENLCHEIVHSSDGVHVNRELNVPVSEETEKFEFCRRGVDSEESEHQEKVDFTVPRQILSCTQPDGYRKVEEKDDREEEQTNRSPGIHVIHRDRRQGAGLRDRDGSLSLHSQRNREAEQELHDMSEKLSRRLEELDLMLKRALSEIGEMCEPGEEDKQSHHSDSIMECVISSCHSSAHAHSLPPFPSPVQHSIQQDALIRDSCNASHSQQQHRNTQFTESDELKQLVQQEQTDMTTERLNAQKTELEYHQAVCRKAPSVHRSCTKSPCSRSSRTKLQHTARKEIHSVKVKDNNLLPILLEEFLRVQLSPHTLSRMWKQQLRQIDQLSSSQNQNRQTQSKLLKQLEEAQKRHDMLVQIIHKEKEHNRRLREFRERIQQQKSAQNKLREQRQQVARAKKYYSVYHVQLRARLMQAKTQEEQKLKQIFEEGLELQKAHLREQRAYTKELRQENYRKYKYEIEDMENYYRDQFSLLAETLAHERQDIQIRKKAQEKALQKMKRELRNKTEKEIGELQKVIIQNDENNYFRDLDVERLQKRVQMASFQYTTSCLQ